jgi:hypothetical protein
MLARRLALQPGNWTLSVEGHTSDEQRFDVSFPMTVNR